MTEQELITTVTEAVAASWSGGRLRVAFENHDGSHEARVLFEIDDTHYEFEATAKRQVNVANAVRIADGLDEANRPRFLLVSEHIQPAVAEVLQKRQVNYADAAGNCHIEQPPLFLHVEGKQRKRSGKTEPVRAFGGEGLKVVFVLLLRPELVSRPYRDLAALSDASHGVVQYTIRDLDRLGFLVRLSRTERRLRNLSDLLDRWAAGYAETLRPKLSMGRFRFTSEDRLRSWQGIDLDPARARWGGEPAASFVTNYLKPARLTLYSRDTRAEAMKRFRVVPDDDGAVEVVRSFWPLPLESDLGGRFADAMVPDVLAYADLLATGDPRNAEVAAMLRERILEEGALD